MKVILSDLEVELLLEGLDMLAEDWAGSHPEAEAIEKLERKLARAVEPKADQKDLHA